MGCWAAAPGLSSAGKSLVWGFGVPPGTTLATGAGCLVPPPTGVGSWGLEQIIQCPPFKPGGSPVLGSPLPAQPSPRQAAPQSRGVRMLQAGPLPPCGGPAGAQGGVAHTRSPHPEPGQNHPLQLGPRHLPVGWVPPCWGRRGSEGCLGGMRGRGAGSCSGWLPEQRAAMLLLSGSVHIIEF